MNTPKAAVLIALAALFATTPLAAKDKSDKKTVKQLKEDIGYLASDALEGRRTGSAGEQKAVDFIVARYQKLGIKAYQKDYRYPFGFVNGKEIMPATQIKVAGNIITNREEAFPLPFSASGKRIVGEVIPGVYEQGNLWMIPLYTDKEEADDAHFDWEKFTFERARDAAKQGASGVLFFDNFGAKFPAEFLPKSEYESLDIPVAMLTNKGYESYMHRTDNSVPVEMTVSLKKAEMTGTNVASFIDNGAKFTVVLGAHLDHLGYGEDGNSLNAKKDRQIHNGADDNASGTAALLELAARIKDAGLKKYNYMFLHFSGEELGLLGSKAFVKDAALDSNKIAYMINMDMLGRLNDSTHALTIGGVGTSPIWPAVIDKKDPQFRISFDSAGVGPSDHTSFYHHGIPVLFFFTGLHTDYHKPSDDADKINYKGEAMVINYIYNVVDKMEKLQKPAFTSTKQTTVGKVRFKVTLGIMPDYSFQEGGVRVDGVTEGKPAVAAGIKAGDIIIQLGEHKINGMQSYMEALGKFAAGDKTQVLIKRGDKEVKLPIEFK